MRINGVVIDATDLDGLARFWAALLELEVTRREPAWISLGPRVAIQAVPEFCICRS